MSIFSSKPLDQTLVSKLYPSIQKEYKNAVLYRTKMLASAPAEHLKIIPTIPNVEIGIGMEIELEKVKFKASDILETMASASTLDSYPVTSYFMVTDDHSLRNNGKEFISYCGLTGQQVLAGVKFLFSELGPFATTPDPSYRTSLHVHVNVLDFTVEEIKKVVLWYAFLEPMFFNMSGNRNKNIFCVPLKDTYFSLAKILNSGREDKNQDKVSLYDYGHDGKGYFFDWAISRWMKYCAFNLLPIRTIGTIEFRHHAGSIDYNEIENWVLFLYQFMIGAKGIKTQTLQQCFDEMVGHWKNKTISAYIEDKFGIFDFDSEELDKHIGNVITKIFEIDQFIARDFEDAPMPKSGKANKTAQILQEAAAALDMVIATNNQQSVLQTVAPSEIEWAVFDPAPNHN